MISPIAPGDRVKLKHGIPNHPGYMVERVSVSVSDDGREKVTATIYSLVCMDPQKPLHRIDAAPIEQLEKLG